jgi:hypothetical protein
VLAPLSLKKDRGVARQLPLVAILGVGVLLRLPHLGDRSLWFDEACSWWTASFPLSELLRSVRHDVHPPLYFFVLKGWMAVWGDSVAALRLLSVLGGALTILGMYLFGLALYPALAAKKISAGAGADPERCGQAFALSLAAFVAVSPCQVQASIEVRMYSLGTALTAFGSWFLLRGLQEPSSVKPWLGFSACAVALLFTHNYGLLTVAAQLAVAAAFVIRLLWRGRRDQASRLGSYLAAAAMLTALCYAPWLLVLWEQAARVHELYWIPPLVPWSLPYTLGELALPEYPWTKDEQVVLCVGAMALLAAAAWRPNRGSFAVMALAILPMASAAGLSLWTPIWYARYFRFAQLFWLAVLAVVIWRVGRGRARAALAGAVILGSCIGCFLFWDTLDLPQRPGTRAALDQIAVKNTKAEPIVVVSYCHFFPARYYAPTGVEVKLLGPDEYEMRYQGGPLVLTTDMIFSEQLPALLGRGAWVIGAQPYPAQIDVPEGLQTTMTGQVRGYYSFHGIVWFGHYIIAEPARQNARPHREGQCAGGEVAGLP